MRRIGSFIAYGAAGLGLPLLAGLGLPLALAAAAIGGTIGWIVAGTPRDTPATPGSDASGLDPGPGYDPDGGGDGGDGGGDGGGN